MAYYPYNTTGGMYPSQTYQSQQYQVQAPQPVQQQSTSLMTVFVNSEQEVNDYPVAAGLTVQLISFSLGKFWLKSTATNGVPQPIRAFTFTEDAPAQPTNQNDQVSRDEFNALNEKLDKLLKDLGGEAHV